VFWILPNFSELTNKIGIHTQQVKHMKILFYSPFVPLDDKFKAVTRNIYKTSWPTLPKAKNDFAQVDSIAQEEYGQDQRLLNLVLLIE
jgi:protease-4